MEIHLKRIGKHLGHYLPLLGVLIAGGWGFVFFSYDRMFQIVIAIAVAFAYVAWGIVHHYLHSDLYFSVILEYLLVAVLGILAVVFLLNLV